MASACVLQVFLMLYHGIVANGLHESRPTCAEGSPGGNAGTCNATAVTTLRSEHALIQRNGRTRKHRAGHSTSKHELIVDWVKFFPMEDATVAASPTWEDHFDSCPDDKPDPGKWKYEIFGPNTKNSEAQTYTSEKENVFCEDGNLVLRALCKDGNNCKDVTCSPGGCHSPYGALTSGSIETAYQFGFGRLTARIKTGGEKEGLVGRGMWPAFWSLGEDIVTNGWPSCGEIDIMEYSQPARTNGQNAYFRNNPYTWTRQHWLTTEAKVETYPMDSEGYRVYTLEFTRDERGHTRLRMWVTETYEQTLDPNTEINIEYPKPGMPHDMVKDFDRTFNGTQKINAKLNVAIGGNLGGKGPYF